MFTELYLLGDKHGAKLPQPCVMILDEFVNLGYFPTYENFLATCRGYGISVSSLIQSIPQLQELYGDKKAKAIIGNHAIKICLGGVEETTAEYFSRLVGDTTIKVYTGGTSESKSSSKNNQRSGSTSEQYSYQKRRLITEGEVLNLQESDKGRKSIVVIQGKPYLLHKIPQFELYGDLLAKHRQSQLMYQSTTTIFSREALATMTEVHHKKKHELKLLKTQEMMRDDCSKKDITFESEAEEIRKQEAEKLAILQAVSNQFEEEETQPKMEGTLPF